MRCHCHQFMLSSAFSILFCCICLLYTSPSTTRSFCVWCAWTNPTAGRLPAAAFQPRCAPRFWNRRWCTRAVSYTHLDVYKRQHLNRSSLLYFRPQGLPFPTGPQKKLLQQLCALQQLFISLISAFFAGHPAFRHAPIISSNQFISSTERCSNLVWGFQSG